MELNLLRISPKELEQLSGIEVSDRFMGGLIGGVYRFSKLKCASEWFVLLFFEGAIAALLTMIALPLGIWLAKGMSLVEPAMTQFMVLIVGGTVVVGLILWNGWMLHRGRSLKRLMHLLDEVDRFHEVLGAVQVLHSLQPLMSNSSAQEIWESLQVTRDCLVAGLKTERVLREKGHVLSRLEDGFTQLEYYVSTLQTLELQEQANEYASILQQTFAISQTVRSELVQMRRQA